MNVTDRAAGALIGALIGDALGLGPHWYYDLTSLHKDYGQWITGYADPLPGRYHAGMKAGQLSQTGLILVMLLRSVLEKGEYQEVDFTDRLDRELQSDITRSKARLLGAAADARRGYGVLEIAIPVLAVLAGLLVLLGLERRIAEYR